MNVWVGQVFQVQQYKNGWLVWTESHPTIRGFSKTSSDLAIANFKEQFRRYLRSRGRS